MHCALKDFSSKSDELNAYEYEKQFMEITDKYNRMLFQASMGKVPASKNEKIRIQTNLVKVDVKKRTYDKPSANGIQNQPVIAGTTMQAGFETAIRRGSAGAFFVVAG